MTSTIKATAVPPIDKSAFFDGEDVTGEIFRDAYTAADVNDTTAATRVSVSAGDTHVKTLDDALVAGDGIAITKQDAGADESLLIEADLSATDIPNLSTDKLTSGVLDEARGGTGTGTYAEGDILYASAVDTLGKLTAGSDGQVLTLASGVPAWASPAGGGGELGASTELTINAGAVTVTGNHHTIDTEGDASTDDLTTINGLGDGDMVAIRAENGARDVVVKHGVGNIRLNGGADFTLDNVEKQVLLIRSGDYVIDVGVPASVGAGSGTVTSVGLSLPAELSVTGSPVSTSGTLTGAWADVVANRVLAGPTTGADATPAFRALVAGDVPNLDAGKITTGQIGIARGGTGAATSATARSNLGLVIGTDVQAFNAGLGNIAGISPTKGHLLAGNGTAWVSVGVGTNDQVLTADSAEAAGVKWAAAAGGGGVSVAELDYSEATNTAGTIYSTGAWRTMTLNNEAYDVDGIVTLAANVFTLVAGTYQIIASTRIGTSTSTSGWIRLQNTSSNTTVARSGYTTVANERNVIVVHGFVTIGASANFELQIVVANNSGTPAINLESQTEKITTISIMKVG